MAFSIINVVTGKYLLDPADPTKTLRGSLTFVSDIYTMLYEGTTIQAMLPYITQITAADPILDNYKIVELKH